jgi:hypothetical protein
VRRLPSAVISCPFKPSPSPSPYKGEATQCPETTTERYSPSFKAEKDGRIDYDKLRKEGYSERLLAILNRKAARAFVRPGGFSNLTF